MLLESRIDDRTILVIDAEAAGGIDKGSLTVQSHPDKVIPQSVAAMNALARAFSAGVPQGEGMPSEMEVTFAVRVDSNAIVTLSRRTDEGQFKVTLRWKKG